MQFAANLVGIIANRSSRRKLTVTESKSDLSGGEGHLARVSIKQPAEVDK